MNDARTSEEQCKLMCAWKGGSPCLAEDCPRRRTSKQRDYAGRLRGWIGHPACPAQSVQDDLRAGADEIDRLQAALAKWETGCTGKHGSQVPCLPVETSGELERLRRIGKAARKFVDQFPSIYVDEGDSRKEWRELNEALFDAGSPVEPADERGCKLEDGACDCTAAEVAKCLASENGSEK